MKKADKGKQKVMEDFTAKPASLSSAAQDGRAGLAGNSDQRDDDIMKLLREIKGSNEAMIARVDNVMTRLDTLNTRVNEISERTTNAENRISVAEDTLTGPTRPLHQELSEGITRGVAEG